MWWTTAGLLVVAMACYSAELDARLGLARGTVTGYLRLTDHTVFGKSGKGSGWAGHLERLDVSSAPGNPEFEAFGSLFPEADRQAKSLLHAVDYKTSSANELRVWCDDTEEYRVRYAGVGRRVVLSVERLGP